MKKQPEGIDVNWVTVEIHWPFPTWIERGLFADEFHHVNEDITATRLVKMFNCLGLTIDRGFASGAVDSSSLKFQYWRKPSVNSRKEKPVELKATLYQHPDYDKVWLLVEYA